MLIGVVVEGMAILTTIRPQQTLEIPLESQIEGNTRFVVLATTEALQKYAAAMAVAKEMHPGAATLVFSPDNLDAVKTKLVELQPKYALVFILPTELDVNFAWRWLTMTTQINDDPFVDVRTGFVTGDSPKSTLAFMLRIKAAAGGRLPLRSRAIDNLGPNTQAPLDAFLKRSGSFMVPVLAQRLTVETISHGTQGFTKAHRRSMDNAGIVHWGGHGYPDRVVDSLDAAGVRALKLAPHVAFNGACYTGVTSRWFEVTTKTIGENTLEVTATLANPALVTTFADTYHSDMSATQQFNDRALVICELPKGWLAVETVQVIEVKAGGRTLEHKLIGFAVERDGGKTLLHVQVDMPSSGYMRSSFRQRGSSVRISAKR